MVAFCRIDTKPIRLREPVVKPDALIIQDVTLLSQLPLLDDVGPDAYVLINSPRPMAEFYSIPGFEGSCSERWCSVPATELATQHTGLGLPNAALLGGFAALTGQLRADSICAAIREKFPGEVGKSNARRRWLLSSCFRRRRTMRKQIEGSRAVAEAVALCRPEVICAYPITPQTHIVEALSEMTCSGDL